MKGIIDMKMTKQFRRFLLLLPAIFGFSSCGNYLDIVPDGVATIDMAFNSKAQTLKYLATCYSYMPKHGNVDSDPAMLGSDEVTTVVATSWAPFNYSGLYLSMGMQNSSSPLFNYWSRWYQALRDCNIFLANVDKTPDLQAKEREQWAAEVKVLKAYYHFLLVQMYGPVPIIRENIPVNADVNTVKVMREPVDECFKYIVELLDEATEPLLMEVFDITREQGRITKPIAVSLKAKVLVTAASPLYNNNSDQATLRNRDGTQLFSMTYDKGKWEKAMNACREAIQICHDAKIELYKYPNTGITPLNDTIATQMSLRMAFTERWNDEIIWANTQSLAEAGEEGVQQQSAAILNASSPGGWLLRAHLGVPLKIARMFYTNHGVPLADDNTRDISAMYDLRTAEMTDRLYLRPGGKTVDMHFDREPRFYAWLGFDTGIWFGQGKTDDSPTGGLWSVFGKGGELDGFSGGRRGPFTGYYPKKFVHYINVLSDATESYSVRSYAWPIMRLSDLYLLYAEAINEFEGPDGEYSAELFEYMRRVRSRAGLEGVKESWNTYGKSRKYDDQIGMRDIIRQERMIELALEGQRFWDVRRWKTALSSYITPIESWSLSESDPALFYNPKILHTQKFGTRDYFWPISDDDIINNPNLVQNIGW